MRSELPAGWVETTLDVVTQINPPGAATAVPDDQEVTFVPMAAVEELSGRMSTANRRKFGEVKKGFTRFRDGDVLFAKITPCMENGKIAVARGLQGGVGCGSTEFHVLRPNGAADAEYIRYFLVRNTYRREAQQNMQGGVGQQRVPTDFLRLSAVPLPPESEQQRIVSRIEELCSEIDEGERALERVRKLVDHYRQAVLKSAIRGELTRAWRDSKSATSQTSVNLEASILSVHREHAMQAPRAGLPSNRAGESREKRLARYEQPSAPASLAPQWLPESWAWVTVAHIAECLDYARIPVSAAEREKREGSIPYFGANGQVGFIDDILFDEPLVLVVEDETFTGRTKPFSYLIRGKSWVNNHAHVLRPTGAIDVRYLNAVLMRYPFIPLTTGTTARRKLTQKALMAAPLAIPPLEEQLAIVEVLDLQLGTADRMHDEAQKVDPQSNALRQSVLKAAFSGQLVPQDPTDEPAAALLARLAAQPDKIPTASRRRARKSTA
jgi:type I restriction enzyme S subunit